MSNLNARKENILNEYKQAKENYLKNMSKENWIIFCDCRTNCMRLGIIL